MKRSAAIRTGLWLALIATLLAAWFAPEEQGSEVALSARVKKNSESPPVSTAVDEISNNAANAGQRANAPLKVLHIKKRKAQDDEAVSLFALSEWQRVKNTRLPENVADKKEESQPPPAPTAPPLPFVVMGKYVEDGKITVFLLQSEQVLLAREGETLANSYKVERVDATAVHLRYLPLDIPQILETGDSL
ncbi:MAG: hypothetical protein FWG81_06890 [Betaproteobacteria bacterium]|nr:hypothetical protein [Betaproteobacteria bacterium]